MGNAHVKPHPRPRNKKQVHWKAADHPSPPGKPHLAADNDLTPDLVTIRWSKPARDGGSPITGYLVEHRRTGSPHWVRATPLLVPFPELTISGLEPGWRYQFRISAENAVGLSEPSDISDPLTVTLQKFAITAPKFTEELKDVTALENEKVELCVHFMGQPTSKICWFKDGFEIFSSRRTRILTDTDRSVLTFHQSALGDEGEIKCTATNKAGHASTKSQLTLEAPPSIRLPRQYEDGLLFEIGEVLRLKVSVAGRPTPLVFWSHNGETIQNDDRYEIEYIDKCSILKLGEALRTDRGEYQIKAVNKIGEDVASFLVTITDKPSPPGRAKVVMTLGRSVTLSWHLPVDDGGCKIGNYIVEYYRLGWNVWLKAATSRQLTTMLGDLIEGSEYKFRIKAESPYGISEPSEESEVVFIPDHKRGITAPQERSKSQPRDILDEMATPLPAKRRTRGQPRSQSSTPTELPSYFNEGEIPVRPERTRIKSPPKTPEASPRVRRKEMNQTILDRASIAREYAYGSPEIKRTELYLPQKNQSDSERSQSRSPVPIASPVEKIPVYLPPKERTPSPKENRRPRTSFEQIEGSSEFMLVLYPDGNEKGQRKFEFDYDDAIPPPLSLSAPELGVEPPIFEKLRTSCSSTELLHERTMIRFNAAAAAEEAEMSQRRFSYDGQHSIDIPKIQINSKDEQNLVGLERKNSFRRMSSGGIVHQQVLWAQRRLSLNASDLNEIIENKLQKSPKLTSEEKRELMMNRQRSESEEKEEQEFEKIRAKLNKGQSGQDKRSIEVVDEDKWLEDYEESLSESETESSEGDSDFKPTNNKIYSEEEEIYHPGVMSIARKTISDAPFEILTKPNKLPDPNFVPKPILKKSEDKFETPKPIREEVKVRSHSPMPLFRKPENNTNRQRSMSLAQPALDPTKMKNDIFPSSTQTRNRSFSLIPVEETENKMKELSSLLSRTHEVSPGHNISAVAQICGIAAASIVIPSGLLQKQKNAEESKVMVDRYGDIVKNYGRRQSFGQVPPSSSSPTLQRVAVPKPKEEERAKNFAPVVPPPPVPPPVSPEKQERQRHDSLSSASSTSQKRSPTPQRGRNIKRAPRKTSQRSKTPSKSPTRLENWSGRSQRKSSPSPLKRPRSKSPSPIPFSKPRPKLCEIMTQTSIGLEFTDSGTSTPVMGRTPRQEALIANAEVKVKSVVDYVTDLAMFFVACWLFLFSNELLAIPILVIMVYRQLTDAVRRRIPGWVLRRFNKNKVKPKKWK